MIDGEICRLDRPGARASPSFSRAAGRSSSTPSTCSSSTGKHWSTQPLTERKRRLREAARPPEPHGARSPTTSTTARRSSPQRASRGSKGVIAKRARRRVQAGQANTRLAEDQAPRTNRSSSSPATRAGPAIAPGRSVRSCSRSTMATSCAMSGTSAPASTTPRSRKLLEAAEAACSATSRPSRRRRRCPACASGDVPVGRAAARRAGALRRVDARRPSPAPELSRPSRRQGRHRGSSATTPLADVIRHRKARAEALEPRQAVLARRGDHERRPAALLPGGRAGAACRI